LGFLTFFTESLAGRSNMAFFPNAEAEGDGISEPGCKVTRLFMVIEHLTELVEEKRLVFEEL
jgi:hypothetical protein